MEVVIVGGGTAGWLSAAAFLHELPFANITLIDKEESTPVSVGEATLIGFEGFLKDKCGFPPEEYLRNMDVTLKGGILFPDWGMNGNAPWHPFTFPNIVDKWSTTQNEPLETQMALYNCSMRNSIDRTQLDGGYALHVDCLKLIEYIKAKIEHKITYIQSSVKNIRRNQGIKSLFLQNGTQVRGDVFIDCTGVDSLLKDKRRKVDLSDRLYVNTAVAGHVDYIERHRELRPFVVCHAVDDGWIWNIPLKSKIGTGLVFNRNITDPEDAKKILSNYWNGRTDELKILNWEPYYDLNQWEKNVISIGLSAGFIEPLESTGIALILEGISTAATKLKTGYFNDYDIDCYNSWMVSMFECCTDFVNMHYSKVTKDTPFWNYVKDNYKMSDAQEFYLDNMKSSDPSVVDGKDHFFGGANWIHWLIMLGYPIRPKDYHICEWNDPTGWKSMHHSTLRKDLTIENSENFIDHMTFVDNYL